MADTGAVSSKALVCHRLFAWIVGLNPAGGIERCILRYSSLRGVGHWSEGILPKVVCV